MSEYQYYEFQAIDRRLTEEEIETLRDYSTRATITPTSFVNEYHWGDFKGNPAKWMEAYFDAFLYFANFGVRELAFRLPRTGLDLKTAQRYCLGHGAAARRKGDHIILEFCWNDDEGSDSEDDFALASLIPLRNDLLAGDHRLLYLAWLVCVQSGELDDDVREPPVPPGLEPLSASLDAFRAFMGVDQDLLDVAADASAPLDEEARRDDFERFVAALPETEKTELVVRLLGSESGKARGDVLRRFQTAQPRRESVVEARTVGELIAKARARHEARRRRAAERVARKQEREERAAAAAREAFLQKLGEREPEAWQRIDALIATKRPQDYDEAVVLLKDLSDLAARRSRSAEVVQRLEGLREVHKKKPSLLKRMTEAGLLRAGP